MKMLARLLLVALLLAAPSARAAEVAVLNPSQTVVGEPLTIFSDEPVVEDAVVLSGAINLTGRYFLGLWYKCTSATGDPDVSFAWLESIDTESTNFVNVETIHSNLQSELPQVRSITPPPMHYGRLQLSGQAVINPADTVCTVKLFYQGGRGR